MRIAVLIKQVPETRSVKMDETTGTVIRDGVESIVNPLDLYAVESALRLRETYGGDTVAITMGPPQAVNALKEVIAMGIDHGLLISDRAFAGSDTWATAYVLAEALKATGAYDLIICGERATDGDTGQVGPAVAAYLNLPLASYVNRIGQFEQNILSVFRLVEHGEEMVDLQLPGVLTVVKEVSEPRLPTLNGKLRARETEIGKLGLKELRLKPELLGLKGSPTRVVKIFRPKVTRQCQLFHTADETEISASIAALYDYLQKKEAI